MNDHLKIGDLVKRLDVWPQSSKYFSDATLSGWNPDAYDRIDTLNQHRVRHDAFGVVVDVAVSHTWAAVRSEPLAAILVDGVVVRDVQSMWRRVKS